MAVCFSFRQKIFMIWLIALTIILQPNEYLGGISDAKTQNLIKSVLNSNMKRVPTEKRSKKKQSNVASATSHAPSTSMIPVPTPAPQRTQESIEKVENTPSPEKAPLPDTKPEQPSGQNISPVERPVQPKPKRVYQVSCPALMTGDVKGKLIPPINDGPQCSARSPLSLTAIGKTEPLKFTNAVTTNCAMAVTLAEWSKEVSEAAKTTFGDSVTITEIGTGSDYQCRNVNGASAGRVSEHAFANALDIMSFKFSDGSKTELESGWNGSEKEKAFWRAIQRASCKHFMTVIGPDGDAAHRTNMHLDQGCHGKSCLARICQ